MKDLVPADLLRQYFTQKATSHDDFFTLRRSLSYQYGVLVSLNHILSIETSLENFMIRLTDGQITILSLPFNPHPTKESPFAVRLSRSIMEFFGETYINSGVLPAFIATVDALSNPKYFFHHSDLTSKPI